MTSVLLLVAILAVACASPVATSATDATGPGVGVTEPGPRGELAQQQGSRDAWLAASPADRSLSSEYADSALIEGLAYLDDLEVALPPAWPTLDVLVCASLDVGQSNCGVARDDGRAILSSWIPTDGSSVQFWYFDRNKPETAPVLLGQVDSAQILAVAGRAWDYQYVRIDMGIGAKSPIEHAAKLNPPTVVSLADRSVN